MQNRKRIKDIENKLMVTKVRGSREVQRRSMELTDTNYYT